MVNTIEEYVKDNFTAPTAIFNPMYILSFLTLLIMVFSFAPAGTEMYNYFTAKRIGYERSAAEQAKSPLPGPGFRGGGDKNYYATFSGATVTDALYVIKNGFGDGTITANTGTITWKGPKGILSSQTTGAQITLTATASSQSVFSSWSGCNSASSNQCTVNFASKAMVTANFNNSVVGATAKSVRFYLPYFHSNANNVTYCLLSNSSSAEVKVSFGVTSGYNTKPAQGTQSFASTVAAGTTRMFRFSGQGLYLVPLTGSSEDSVLFSTDVGSSEPFSGHLRVVSSTGGDVNCKNEILTCFQGTSNPKRNVAGFLCEDDSTAGAGGLRNLLEF
ncbi:MAG: hypothetical protein H7844_05995 [Nitrospirae bacterium YQR-1]